MLNFKNLFAILAIASSLNAASTQCSGIFYKNEAPDIVNTRLTNKVRELCSSEFAVLHSGIVRGPLLSAEHLYASYLSTKIERTDDFHADERIPADERAELSDFAHSGYDRGHLANARDMHTQQGEHESFALSNMIMQNPKNNRGIFSDIEQSTRNLAMQAGELYVISGPLFLGSNIKRVNGRVMVPTKIYKAIYDPASGQGAAYLVNNDSSYKYEVVSIAKIEQLSGIKLFPKMSSVAKQTPMDLLPPKARGNANNSNYSNTIPPAYRNAYDFAKKMHQ